MREGRGAERDRDEAARGGRPWRERAQACAKLGCARGGAVAGGVARLLLPQRDDVEHHGHDGRALDDLDQPDLGEVAQQHAEDERAADHADQQHHVESATTRGRASCGARSVASARPAVCVVCRPAPTSRKASAAPTWPTTRPAPCRVARQHQQRERHDGEAAELQQRADPDVGHAPPAEHRAVGVGAEADQRAERREDQRQRHHQRRRARSARRARRSSRG